MCSIGILCVWPGVSSSRPQESMCPTYLNQMAEVPLKHEVLLMIHLVDSGLLMQRCIQTLQDTRLQGLQFGTYVTFGSYVLDQQKVVHDCEVEGIGHIVFNIFWNRNLKRVACHFIQPLWVNKSEPPFASQVFLNVPNSLDVSDYQVSSILSHG